MYTNKPPPPKKRLGNREFQQKSCSAAARRDVRRLGTHRRFGLCFANHKVTLSDLALMHVLWVFVWRSVDLSGDNQEDLEVWRSVFRLLIFEDL